MRVNAHKPGTSGASGEASTSRADATAQQERSRYDAIRTGAFLWRYGVKTVSEIIASMRAVAPPGEPRLDDDVLAELRALTQALIAARTGAAEEHARFLAIAERGLCLPEAGLAGRLRDATVLVTGGTGCIGSTLMAQLAARCSGRLVSVSRGVTGDWPRQPSAEYRYADVRNRPAIEALIAEIRPDLVFHVAAQRDPGLAEIEVHRTVSTNVLGTRTVLTAAAEAGVPQVVCASTGKALRPYSPDMYTASWSMLDCTLRAAPPKALMRSAAMAGRHSASLGADHRRILEAIEDHAAG